MLPTPLINTSMKLINLFEKDVFNDFDEWKSEMKSRGADHLEQEDELSKIHVYAFTPDGRVQGVWHKPQQDNMGVCYDDKEGRKFDKRGRKFKYLEKL